MDMVYFEGTSCFEMSILDTIEAEQNEWMGMYVSDEDSPPDVPNPPKEKNTPLYILLESMVKKGSGN